MVLETLITAGTGRPEEGKVFGLGPYKAAGVAATDSSSSGNIELHL
jgi:hypothetical protein